MESYASDLLHELALISDLPVTKDRTPSFVYFGGGTPSLLPLAQLKRLFNGIRTRFPWQQNAEVSFECAPKTATPDKLEFLREAGVTRISMGIQQLDDKILKANGRIHKADDAKRAYTAIRNAAFPIVNVDLIVGLVGETDETFFDSLNEVIGWQPDSITIYQLEIPPNTPLFKAQTDDPSSSLVPDWTTKRRRLNDGFTLLEEAGYKIRSAYSAVRDLEKHKFTYQEAQYRGVDLIGTGVSSFSYVQGVHYQNLASMGPYRESIGRGELPIFRGLKLSDDERLVRQFILQLKLGVVPIQPFQDEFGVDVRLRFADPLANLDARGLLTVDEFTVGLTRSGLLCVDRILLEFCGSQYRDVAYW